jgi:hypothetical protein
MVSRRVNVLIANSIESGQPVEFVGQCIPEHPLIHRRLLKEGKPLAANQQGYGYIG